ncbi:MAG: phosphate signaling complex protein PhoU, partial [Pseudomonadales bacterium]|nr:phosphate signaling complex protein PhoU [Pseudomonadales bacterium]
MSKHLDRDISSLRDHVLELGQRVAEMIEKSILMIQNYDRVLVQEIYSTEESINDMEVDVEEECLKILALHQPVAEDLRFLIVVLKVNNDLERMGDQVVNVAERIEYIADKQRVVADLKLTIMADLCANMVNEAIMALTQRDVAKAKEIVLLDDELDSLHARTYEQLTKVMMDRPESITPALSLLTISSNLERIGDLATNIAEEIIFMEEGEIIRHAK